MIKKDEVGKKVESDENKSTENQLINSAFCTQDRDRTGTPKNWCLRPARLPIPPPGLVLPCF